ncbi:MAG: secondary thiamine-phosphate synthase enzyme YjbQ, partial [Anaerolineales bacterium]
MAVETRYIPVETGGDGDILDLTQDIQNQINSSGINDGVVTIFTPSATSGITTLEFEPGCVKDLQRLFNEIIPPERDYAHNQRWGDGNGHSHTRAGLIKPSLTVPIVEGKMTLGTWQSIILVDFDN